MPRREWGKGQKGQKDREGGREGERELPIHGGPDTGKESAASEPDDGQRCEGF